MERTLCVVLVILVCGVHSGLCSLQDDLKEFEGLMDMGAFVKAYLSFLQYGQFRDEVEFLTSDAFRDKWMTFYDIPEVKELFDYIHETGLPILEKINLLGQLLGLPPVPARRTKKSDDGFTGFVDSLKHSFPEEAFEDLIKSKLQTSADFRKMYFRLKSEKYRSLYERCMNTVQVQLVIQFLETKNIRLEDLLDLARYYTGWGRLI